MNDKVVVITGASAGIGAAAAEEIARRGHAVVLVARRAAELNEAAQRCGARVQTIVADMSRRDEVERAAREAIDRWGRVDVWINNVGRGITRRPSELTDEDIDEVMQVNVKSALYGMQAMLPHFKARGTGHVINISSLLGRMPLAHIRSAYCGAKHFLNALTATIRTDVQETHPDIQFSIVSPGIVRTEFGLNARGGGPDSRTLPDSQSAEEIAVVIADVIESRQPDVYTRRGAQQRIAAYYARLGADPQTELKIDD